MFKNQKGITLIALVITIIVLLILAGITIALITSNESAPNKAGEAKIMQYVGEAKDQIAINSTTLVTHYYEGKFVTRTNNVGDAQTYIETYDTAGAGTENGEKNYLFENVSNNVTLPTTGIDASHQFTIISKETNSNNKKYQVTGTVDKNGGITWSDEGWEE